MDAWFTPNTNAGPLVNSETALRVPTVKASVQLISSTVGTTPLKVFERLPDGSKRTAPDHDAYALAHREPNEYQSAIELRTLLAVDAFLHGNAFAFLNTVNGRVIEQHRLDPRSVTIRVRDDFRPEYVVSAKAGVRVYSPAEIMHIAAPGPRGPNGITGIAPIFHAREAIALAMVLEAKMGAIFKRGGRPSGLLQAPAGAKLPDDAVRRMKASWEAAHAGENSGGTAFLEGGTDFKSLTFSSVDTQFDQLRTAQFYEIARSFNVPPSLVGIVDRATWGNTERENRGFLTYCLRPWLATFKAAYNRALLSSEERDTFFLDFITDDLTTPDSSARAEVIAKERAAGVLTANEARALKNLPPLLGGDILSNPYTTAATVPAKDAA